MKLPKSLWKDVPVIAVWVPETAGTSPWISQDQPVQDGLMSASLDTLFETIAAPVW